MDYCYVGLPREWKERTPRPHLIHEPVTKPSRRRCDHRRIARAPSLKRRNLGEMCCGEPDWNASMIVCVMGRARHLGDSSTSPWLICWPTSTTGAAPRSPAVRNTSRRYRLARLRRTMQDVVRLSYAVLILFVVMATLAPPARALAQESRPDIEVFTRTGCPRCAAALERAGGTEGSCSDWGTGVPCAGRADHRIRER